MTPAWLQRLYRSPALVQPMTDLPRLLVEYMPRVAASLGTELPDLSQVADVLDATPEVLDPRDRRHHRSARAAEGATTTQFEFDVPPAGFPQPLAFQTPERGAARPRVVRRDVGAEMGAVQQLLNLGFARGRGRRGAGRARRRGDRVLDRGHRLAARGLGALHPERPRRREGARQGRATRARVSSGVDWLSLDMTFEAEGVGVDERELRECLAPGRRLVRLQDGTYAPVKTEEVSRDPRAHGRDLRDLAATASCRSRRRAAIQELLALVGNTHVTPATKELFGKLQDIDEIEQIAKPRTLKATLRPYQKEGFSWLVFLHELNDGRHPRRRHGSR